MAVGVRELRVGHSAEGERNLELDVQNNEAGPAVVTYAEFLPSLGLSVRAVPTTFSATGQVIQYTYRLTNASAGGFTPPYR